MARHSKPDPSEGGLTTTEPATPSEPPERLTPSEPPERLSPAETPERLVPAGPPDTEPPPA